MKRPAYLQGSVVAGRGVPKHWGLNQAVGESQRSGPCCLIRPAAVTEISQQHTGET